MFLTLIHHKLDLENLVYLVNTLILLLFEDKQSPKLGRVDKCSKVVKSHIYFKHLLTYFVRYPLGFPHFSVNICFKLYFVKLF